MTKRFGFTLAEVLVTLTIIGVVASMTVPTLMTNTSTQEMTAGYKKAMSTLNQAITMQYALEGTDMRDFDPTLTAPGNANNEESLAFMLRNRLQVTKHITGDESNNERGNENGGWEGTADDGGIASAAVSSNVMYLADGTVLMFPTATTRSGLCTLNGVLPADGGAIPAAAAAEGELNEQGNTDCLYSILVDVNGDRGNCTWARNNDRGVRNGRLNPGDCFIFDVYPDGVRPGDWMGVQLMAGKTRVTEEDNNNEG